MNLHLKVGCPTHKTTVEFDFMLLFWGGPRLRNSASNTWLMSNCVMSNIPLGIRRVWLHTQRLLKGHKNNANSFGKVYQKSNFMESLPGGPNSLISDFNPLPLDGIKWHYRVLKSTPKRESLNTGSHGGIDAMLLFLEIRVSKTI